jgi:hypothetical protein
MGLVELAEATKWTGDVVVDPEVGEVIVTPAKDAALRARVVISNRRAFFTACTPSELGWIVLRREVTGSSTLDVSGDSLVEEDSTLSLVLECLATLQPDENG